MTLRLKSMTAPDMSRQAQVAAFAEAVGEDLYLREATAGRRDDLHALAKAIDDLALMVFKPDAIVGRRGPTIMDYIEAAGFAPIAAARARMTRHSMRELWRKDWQPFSADRLMLSTLWYCIDDVPVFLLRDLRPQPEASASERLSALKVDLRRVLAPPNRLMNFVHIADDSLAALQEAAVLLGPDDCDAFLDAAIAPHASRRADALALIRALEAEAPPHDLDAVRSIERLRSRGAVSEKSASRLHDALADGETLSWPEVSRLAGLGPEGAEGQIAWDTLAVAAHLIPLEREGVWTRPGA